MIAKIGTAAGSGGSRTVQYTQKTSGLKTSNMRCAPYRSETSRLHTDAHLALHISGLGVALGGASERAETVLLHALGQLDDGLVLVFFDEFLRRLDDVVED